MVSLDEEMNAEKFRTLALDAITNIESRRKRPIVVGGCGLYIKALTHGLSALPASGKVRTELNGLTVDQLRSRLADLDPEAAATIDTKNPRRLVRALAAKLKRRRPPSKQ